MTYIVDPLEQFSIELVKSYHGSEISVSILPYTTIGKINLVVAILIFLIMYVDKLATLNKIKKVANILFSLILRTVRDSVEVKKNSFPILFYVLFLFILATNILGMLPYSLTATSHLIVTLFFSLAFFISNNIIGLCYHKDKYFVLFLPSGVPTWIAPFLILVEYVSYISRVFSLAIRLFANMLSGHILLKILISFIWVILCSNLTFLWFAWLPMGVVFIVIGLELSISFLQAYVFIVLLTIYLNDVINTH